MYGQVHVVVKELVESQFGQTTWKKIVSQSGMDEETDFLVFSVYDDVTTSRLIESACRVLEITKEDLLKEFGTYFLTYCMKHGYDKMLLTLGQDLFTFVQNLDSLYSMLSLSYKGIVSPSFRCQEHEDGTLTLDYFSWRQGYYPIVQGIVEAVGKHLYHQEATVSVVTTSEEEVSRGTFQYMTTMKVAVHGMSSADLEEQHSTASQKRQHQRRKTIDISKVTQCGEASRLTLGELCNAFPYHILMDGDLRVLQCGNAIRRLVTFQIDHETHLYNIANIRQPIIPCTATSIISFINSVFTVEIISIQQCPIVLKGQMVWLPNCCHIMFMGSLRLQSLTDMKEKKVFVSDMPIYDCTRELALLNQQRMSEIEAAKKLDEATMALKNTSKELTKEKQKTEELLHEMMPRQIAQQLTQQGFVNAVKYDGATVLFSNMLTFADIVWSCSADQVVNMLNDMYFRFDNHTDTHKVYKVETIGDAYMAVTGVPSVQQDHAERMADFAMDMLEEASYVRSPATGLPLQIQVGFHSGSVVAGVIGHKKPRYDIYGDTVNVASRMCSNSVPSRIHVTSVAFEKLYKRGYVFKTRGEIDVKGKGKMTTYFLVGTLERDLEQPDDKFSFLPDVLDADAQIDPSIKKFVKKKLDVAGPGGKVMTVQQSRKSTVFYRHMKDVKSPGHVSSSTALNPDFHTISQHSSLSLPGHHKETWNLSPPPPSAGVNNFQPRATFAPTPVQESGRIPGSFRQRKATAYPEHHRQTWNLSPPVSTAADFRTGGDSKSPGVNKSNSSCNADDSRISRFPNKSNSSCHVSSGSSKRVSKGPNKSDSSGKVRSSSSKQASRSPNKRDSSGKVSSVSSKRVSSSPNKSGSSGKVNSVSSKRVSRSPTKRDSSGKVSSVSSKRVGRSPTKRDSSGKVSSVSRSPTKRDSSGKVSSVSKSPNKSGFSGKASSVSSKRVSRSPTKSDSSDTQDDTTSSSSSDQCESVSTSSHHSRHHGDNNLSPATSKRSNSSSKKGKVSSVSAVSSSTPNVTDTSSEKSSTHDASSPSKGTRSPSPVFRFSPSSFLPSQSPREAQEGLFVWSDVRENILGEKTKRNSLKPKRLAALLRSRQTSSCCETMSLQGSESSKVSALSAPPTLRRHSLPTMSPRLLNRDQGWSALYRKKGDQKSCLLS